MHEALHNLGLADNDRDINGTRIDGLIGKFKEDCIKK